MAPAAAGSHPSVMHCRLKAVGHHAAALAQSLARARQIEPACVWTRTGTVRSSRGSAWRRLSGVARSQSHLRRVDRPRRRDTQPLACTARACVRVCVYSEKAGCITGSAQPTCSLASGRRCRWLLRRPVAALWNQTVTAFCHTVQWRVPGSNPAAFQISPFKHRYLFRRRAGCRSLSASCAHLNNLLEFVSGFQYASVMHRRRHVGAGLTPISVHGATT